MSSFIERHGSTPDAYRSRALAAAGLVATGTAAVAAGALFRTSSSTPPVASAATLVAVTFLLVSVILYTAAGLYVRKEPSPSEEAHIKAIVGSVLFRMRLAASAAMIAALSVLVVVTTLLIGSRQDRAVSVVIDRDAVESLTECELSAANVLSGRVPVDQLSSDSPFEV
jgi:hypothetical protein